MKTSKPFGLILPCALASCVAWLPAIGGGTAEPSLVNWAGSDWNRSEQVCVASESRVCLISQLDSSRRTRLEQVLTPKTMPMPDRFASIRGAGRHLTPAEVDDLCLFLRTPAPAQERGSLELGALKNDILNLLRDQAAPPTQYVEVLAAIYHESDQGAVMRDYALQHLAVWYEQGAGGVLGAKEKIRALLREAARENSGLAGTALLGWHRLPEGDLSDQRELERFAVEKVKNDFTDTATRISAIQVCAERGLEQVIPVITVLAETAKCVPLRLSALAALRRLKGERQFKFTSADESLRSTHIEAFSEVSAAGVNTKKRGRS